MILAYKRGTLVLVTLLEEHPITTRLQDADGKQICYRESDTNRKLFKGDTAVADATAWILGEEG